VRASHDSARTKFEKANKAFENRGQLEEQRVVIEEQLAKARAKLPDTFNVDQFLRKATMIGQESGVELRTFDPEEERCGNSVVNHKELPINFELLGKFSQIASFMDRLVHLDMSVTIDKVKLLPASVEKGQEAVAEETIDVEAIRRDFKIRGNFSVLLYKSVAIEGECAGGGTPPPAMAPPADASQPVKEPA
jgi:type IV pilus assembly protein PilO